MRSVDMGGDLRNSVTSLKATLKIILVTMGKWKRRLEKNLVASVDNISEAKRAQVRVGELLG
jgi:hypothetical protein